MNDTLGDNSLVSLKPVFDIIPRFLIFSSNLPNQKKRVDMLKTGQREMNSIVAEKKHLEALTRNVSSAADRSYNHGDKFLVYSKPK